MTEDKKEEKEPKFDPELISAIRKQVLDELKSDDERQKHEDQIRREEESQLHQDYVEKMKESSDPWVDIQGLAQTSEGIRIELDWNDAFATHLRENGITGADDEQVVQHWVTLLLHDMTGQMEDDAPEKGAFE